MLPFITVTAQSMIEPMCIVKQLEYLQQYNVATALIDHFNCERAVYDSKNNYSFKNQDTIFP